jgi:general secretion pathway protein N
VPAPSSRRSAVAATPAGTVAVAIVCVVLVVVSNAPANWLALYVARKTEGVVLLADAQGTIWSGSAVLGLGAPQGWSGESGSQSSAPRLALPGRIIWRLEWTSVLAPVLHLTHDGVLLQPTTVRYAAGGLAIDAGAAVLPAAILELAGPPLNTLRPDGRCTLRWNATTIDSGGLIDGEGTLRIDGLALAISVVRPLGSYLLTWASGARGVTWQLATESGPLALVGNGVTTGRATQARIVVSTAADATPAAAAQLAPLLDTIGRRGPNEAVIETRG